MRRRSKVERPERDPGATVGMDTDTGSVASTPSATSATSETLEDLVSSFRREIETLSEHCSIVRKQVRALYRRATEVEPRPRRPLRDWCETVGVDPTVDAIVRRILVDAIETDLEERTLIPCGRDVALLGLSTAKTRISFFDLLQSVPALFHTEGRALAAPAPQN